MFTIFRVHEYDPETYARYHGIKESDNQEGGGWIELLKKAPKVFWQVSLVQFFCWISFQYLSTYATGAIAQNVWNTTNASSAGYQIAGNWFGVLTAVQSIAAVVWSYVLAKVPNNHHKFATRWSRIYFNLLDSFSGAFNSILHFNWHQLGWYEYLSIDDGI